MIETGDRIWLLTGASGSYALRLTERHELLHLHWGPRLTLFAAEALAAAPAPPGRGFESPLDGREEYPVEGGPRFVRPALSVRTDEVRGTAWTFTGDTVDGDELRLSFADPVHRLSITLHYRMRDDSDVIERWTTLAHTGPDGPPVEVLRADAAAWALPARDRWRLSRLHGRWAAETQLERTELAYGEHLLSSRRGHTGHQGLPWVALDADGAATEESGEVYGCALGWSGSWRIAVQRLPDGLVQITGGAGYDESGLLRLSPGSRTPPRSSPDCGARAASVGPPAPGTPGSSPM